MKLMRMVFVVFIIAFIIITYGISSSSEKIIKPISILGPSTIKFPATERRPGFTLEISEDCCYKGSWPEDHFLLQIKEPEDSNTLAETRFISSYGDFDLQLVDVTGDGIEEFILVWGKGRGTSARQEHLSVLMQSGKIFKPILEILVSDYFGSGLAWWYDREFKIIDNKGPIALRLDLKNSPFKGCDLCSPSLIPKEKTKEFVFDTEKKVMVPRTIVK